MDKLFNGFPPYTPEEAKDNKILVNVNFREGTTLLHQARRQYENAFLKPGQFFSVTIPDAPPSKRREYETTITREVNALMKGSGAYQNSPRARQYRNSLISQFAGVCLHGVGPQMWEDQWKWSQFSLAQEDLLIPTYTELTHENLTHFAVRRRMTRGQLIRKTIGAGKNMDPGWKLKRVSKLLDDYKDENQNIGSDNWTDQPERMQELWKANKTWWDTDAVPTIKLWDFYYQEEDGGKTDWRRVILPDQDCIAGRNSGEDPITFLYQKDDSFAANLDQILHIQYGDGNNVPPFIYHSVRGLGWLLFDVVHLMNRLRCQEIQHVFEQLLTLYRCKDPSDRARLDSIVLTLNKAILPQDVSIVPAGERFQVDQNTLEAAKSGLKQLMGEGSASYTQDIDTGTDKQQTATEVNAKVQSLTALTSSLLINAYIQAVPAYQENCRRLTLKNTLDWDAKRFQARLGQQRIPEKWIDSARWEIEPERVLGAGNKQLEIAQAQQLYQVRVDLSAPAQAEVMHDLVLAVTDDPKRANRLAPLDGAPKVTDTTHDTELVFGTLMGGRQVTPKPGLNPIEVCDTMIAELEAEVQKIMQSGGMGTPQDLQGFSLAGKYVGSFVQMLDKDKMQKPRVKQYSDRMGKIMNEVKAFAQRQQEAQKAAQQQGAQDPEAMAKLQMDAASAKQKLAIDAAKHQQKMQHKNMEFSSNQKRRNLEVMGDQKRKNIESLSGIRNDAMTTSARATITAKQPKKEKGDE